MKHCGWRGCHEGRTHTGRGTGGGRGHACLSDGPPGAVPEEPSGALPRKTPPLMGASPLGPGVVPLLRESHFSRPAGNLSVKRVHNVVLSLQFTLSSAVGSRPDSRCVESETTFQFLTGNGRAAGAAALLQALATSRPPSGRKGPSLSGTRTGCWFCTTSRCRGSTSLDCGRPSEAPSLRLEPVGGTGRKQPVTQGGRVWLWLSCEFG